MDTEYLSINLYRPDLIMFEQIILQTWRLICRSSHGKEGCCMNFPMFAHIYRGYLCATWITTWQTKYRLNSVTLPEYFKVDVHDLFLIYRSLLIPKPIHEAVKSILTPIMAYTNIYYPAPMEFYTDYKVKDYFHGSTMDTSLSKSIDFSASFHRVLVSLGQEPMQYSSELKGASCLPGHTNTILQLRSFREDDKKFLEEYKSLTRYYDYRADDFTSIVKPLHEAFEQLRICFRNCFGQDLRNKVVRFGPLVNIKPRSICVLNMKNQSMYNMSIYSKCSFLTEGKKRISFDVNADSVCKVVINRADDPSDFNVQNDSILRKLDEYLTFETGEALFLKNIIHELSLGNEKYPYAHEIKYVEAEKDS